MQQTVNNERPGAAKQMRTQVLGVGFDNITAGEAVEQAMTLISDGRGQYVVTPNPEIVWLSRKNDGLKQSLREASLVLPDGIGVIYGAKTLGRPLRERIPGIEFAEQLFARLAADGKSVFMYGAKPGVADVAAAAMAAKYPGLVIAGTADGYVGDDSIVIERINAAKPDFLMVCLGAPKQEIWMAQNADSLDVGLMAGLGGSLDVFAGTAERAPESWRRLNLEWLYRLVKQPRRIGRMMKLPLFMLAVFVQRLRRQ